MSPPTPAPTSREWLIAVVLTTLSGAVAALALGQPWSPDLDTYHFYNGFALLAGRLDQDIAPAGPASYFNPLLDVFHYLGVRYVHPAAFTAFLGAVQGLNIVLVWAIARRVLGIGPWWISALAALMAACGQNAVALLGDMFGDNTVSIPALAGLLAVLMGGHRPRWLLVAGALGGGAAGVKLTMAGPHLALGAVACWIAWNQRRPWLLVAFAFGSLVGWSLTHGWWSIQLWQRFGNPLFPFFNNIFHSPFLPSGFLHDVRWTPDGLLAWARGPIDAAVGRHEHLQELPFRDARLLAGVLGALVWLIFRLRTGAGRPTGTPAGLLILYWTVGYAAWATVWGYYRYATVLELLAPVVALSALQTAWPRRLGLTASLLAVSLLLTTDVNVWARSTKPPPFGFRPFWYRARLPPEATEPHQLILLPEWKTSYAAAFFPEDAAFISLAYEDMWGPAMEKAIADRIAHHQGPIRVLKPPSADHERVLDAYGLEPAGSCELARFGRGRRLLLCPVARRAP